MPKPDPGVVLSKFTRDTLTANASGFCRPFTVVRGHNPIDEVKDLKTTARLIVMPGERKRDALTRATRLRTVTIWVAILAKLAPGMGSRTEDRDNLEDIDELSAFVTQLEEFFVPNSDEVVCLSDEQFAFDCISAETDPDYLIEQLGRSGVFASLLKLDFEQTAQ